MVFSTVPFTRLPIWMTIELVLYQEFWYNFTMPVNYVLSSMPEGTIASDTIYDYNRLYGTGSKYGEYTQAHKKMDNTMRSRTVSAICLKSTANVQSLLFYYSMVTGRRLHDANTHYYQCRMK